MSYSLTPLAQIDIDEITKTIWSDSPRSAEEFVEKIFETFEQIASMPGIGHKRGDLTAAPVLFWAVLRFNVAVIYHAQPNVEILRVVSWRRDIPALLGGAC